HTKILKRFYKLESKNGRAMKKIADEKRELFNLAVSKVLNETAKEASRRATFSYYAQNYVERIINDWQQRSEFEKLEDWRLRVNEKTRSQKIYELTADAQKAYISQIIPQLPPDSPTIIGNYDPDNETYLIRTKYSDSDILVHVPSVDAQEFKANFANLKHQPSFFVENDGIGLSEYHFTMPNGTKYSYSNQASLTHNIANVEYSFNAVEIDGSSANRNFKGGKQTINTKNLSFGTSDIDVGIPKTAEINDKTFAVIIANENYQQEDAVDFAYNDGSIFRQYCIKTLGLPENNVHFRPDATLNDIRFEFNWLKQMADAYEGNAKFIVYYAGHGMPDAKTKDAYLLPIDGYGSDITSGYKLSDLYETLGNLPSENVLAFVDACFSGSQRDGHSMSKGDRGVAITPDIKTPKGNLVVFSATSGNETAHAYNDKQHGMFTYFLLKKLKEHNGHLSFGDLTSYVTKEVKITALRDKNLAQTPTVTTGDKLSLEWRKIQIK
ncbi:MAG: caspase family protein, partial [Muribaculaceae bacterium]|nr:caspase family protein [Muribaculaceae bacterium]